MFNKLIILIAVIKLTKCQEPPEVDDVAVLSSLASANLQCSLKFDRDFIASSDELQAVIEAIRVEHGGRDVTRPPRRRDDDDATEEAEATEARRALRGKGRGRRGGDRSTREAGATREPRDVTKEPCAEGEDCKRRRRRHDDSTKEPCDDDATEEAEATEVPSFRRALRGKGRGRRGGDRSTREAGATREPREVTKEPCAEGEDCQRKRRRHRNDDSTKEPCDDDATEEAEATEAPSFRRALRGKGRGRRGGDDSTREAGATQEPRDVTKEPCAEGEDCQRKRHRRRDNDSTKEPCDDDATEEAEATEAPSATFRRALRGKGRGRRGADGSTREAGATREPRDVTKEPCAEGEDCQRKRRRRRDDDSTEEEEAEATEAPSFRRALRGKGRGRRGGDDSTREAGATREPRDVTKQPCAEGKDCQRRDDDSTREPRDKDADVTAEASVFGRLIGGKRKNRGRHGRRRKDDATTEEAIATEAPTEAVQRRALGGNKRDGRRRGQGIAASIFNGIVDIAGVDGEVEFGEVDESGEKPFIPLTLTIGETSFDCNVEVKRGRVACRAVSSDDFQAQVDCTVATTEPEA